ncbi:MAG: nucleotidyltransferase domain-containing protein [Chloroflexi bacterium]|nr:nucleotidyltransferase domain-containing protein [Chloroflexota bacterium]
MPETSSPGVRVWWFPKDEAWAAARAYARELGQSHPEVELVLVFGSLVRNEAVPGSDVDFLVVLTESSVPFFGRSSEYQPERFPVGTDVFVYTQAELDDMLAQGNFFIKRALGEGVELFRRQQ